MHYEMETIKVCCTSCGIEFSERNQKVKVTKKGRVVMDEAPAICLCRKCSMNRNNSYRSNSPAYDAAQALEADTNSSRTAAHRRWWKELLD